jgi:cytochrome c-type biogenesis protein CcmH/NrfF
MVWLIPVAILAFGALRVVLRFRRSDPKLTSEPLSGQWLAEARSREEHPW